MKRWYFTLLLSFLFTSPIYAQVVTQGVGGNSPWVFRISQTTTNNDVDVINLPPITFLAPQHVIVDSGSLTDAQLRATPVPVSGTITFANTSLAVTNTGTFLVQAAQSGTWNIGTVTTLPAITQGTSPWISRVPVLSVTDTLTSLNDLIDLPLTGQTGVGFHLGDTGVSCFSGVIKLYETYDGTNYNFATAYEYHGGLMDYLNAQSWNGDCGGSPRDWTVMLKGGVIGVRLLVTSYTSGTMTVTINATNGQSLGPTLAGGVSANVAGAIQIAGQSGGGTAGGELKVPGAGNRDGVNSGSNSLFVRNVVGYNITHGDSAKDANTVIIAGHSLDGSGYNEVIDSKASAPAGTEQGLITRNIPYGTQAVSAASLPLPTGAATSALQTQPGVDIGDVTINNATGGSAVNIQDGGNSITVDATSLPLPTLAATSTKQSDGTQKTQLVDGSGNVVSETSNALDINIKSGSIANTSFAATQATAANLNMTEASAAAIKADVDKIPSQGQALASASMPIVLTAAQIITLTPPAAITGYALETGGNLAGVRTAVETIDNFISGSRGLVTEDNSAAIKTAVEVIDNFISGARGLVTEDNSAAIKADVDKIPSQGQALAGASMPVVLPAAQITTLTPPAAITGFALETTQILQATATKQDTGNTSLGTIKTNTDPFVTSGGGGYVRQDSTATIAKETGGNLAGVRTAVETIDNFISGARGLVTEDNSAAIKADVDKIPSQGLATMAASMPVVLASNYDTAQYTETISSSKYSLVSTSERSGSLIIGIAGTWSGTFYFTFVDSLGRGFTLPAINLATGLPVSSTTTNGVFLLAIGGWDNVGTLTSWISGSADIAFSYGPAINNTSQALENGNLATIKTSLASVIGTPGSIAPVATTVVAGVDPSGIIRTMSVGYGGTINQPTSPSALLWPCNALRKTSCR